MAAQKISEIVAQEAFDQVTKLTDLLNKLNDAAAKNLVQLSQFKNTTGYADPKAPKVLSETEASMKQLVKGVNDLTTAQAKYNAAVSTAPGSIRAMESEIDNLRKKGRELDLSQEQNVKTLREYNARIKELSTTIKQNTDVVDAQRRNIGNYGDTVEKLKGAVIGAATGVLTFTGAMKAAQFVIEATDNISDKFEQTVAGMKEGVLFLGQAIANADFANFTKGLKDAVAAGREYTEVMQDIEDLTRGMTIQEKQLKIALLEQEKVYRDRTKSVEERAVAIVKAKRLQQDFTDAQVALTQKELDAAVRLAAQRSKLSQDDVKRYVASLQQDFEKIKSGEKLVEQEKALRQNAIITNNVLADLALNLVYGTKGSDQLADSFIAKLTPAQKAAYDAAKGYTNITKDLRDQIAGLIVKQTDQSAAVLEQEVSVLRATNSINKQADAEGKLAEKTREATGETIKQIASLKNTEGDAFTKLLIQSVEDYIITEQDAIKINELRAKAEKEATEQQLKGMKERTGSAEKLNELNAQFDADEVKRQEEGENRRKINQRLAIESAQATLDIIAMISATDLNNKKTALDDEMASIEDQYKRKLITKEQYEKKKEEIDARSRKLQHDAAVRQKQLALAQAIISTAQAVTQALTVMPPWLGIALAILAGVTGAAEIATISSTNIPKYEKGRKGGKAELAYVHEGEIISTKGKAFGTPNKETLTFLPEGADVIPRHEVELMKSMAFSGITIGENKKAGYDLGKMVDQLSRDNAELVRVIKNKDTVAEVKMRGMYESWGWNGYIERNFKQ